MSSHQLWTGWINGCMDRGGFGVSHGDTMHRGLRNFDEPYPCPNGHEHRILPFEELRQIPAYARRLEKARQDIARHALEFPDEKPVTASH
ncbi:MAG: hypothetical protein E6R03_10465 [Hyphomicrobiaceae bacterium]|nr:MAG: hypothetical protein E6R03_10465 [Hyphomicrobiaceae bacterium]